MYWIVQNTAKDSQRNLYTRTLSCGAPVAYKIITVKPLTYIYI